MSMWLFGYGSLIWKAEFPYKRKVTGFIKGYVRRFYQASPDHRGVPTKPGRVVTLLPSSNENDVVWGLAYEISTENYKLVLQDLDYREKSYDRARAMFHPAPNEELSEPFEVFVYIGNQGNRWFLGDADLESIAKQIAEAHGRSGTNADYLFRLAESMRRIAPEYDDDHLFDLEVADIVWGVAYEIAQENCQYVLDHLDYREKSGYDKANITFHPGPNEELSQPFELFVYIGSQENEWFVGDEGLESIARQIAEAKGPSGTNAEYLFQLANSMRHLAPHYNDTHLYNLEEAVNNILAFKGGPLGKSD